MTQANERFISICSGVGGIDLGLERAGWRIVAQCEKDAYRRGVLARHWAGVPCFEDIREVSSRSVGERLRQVDRDSGGADAQQQRVPLGGQDARAGVDLICGGTPCQDLTVRSHQRPGSNSSTDILCAPFDSDGVRETPRTPGRLDDPPPDGSRYSACGDAVTVNVAQWVGERILAWETAQ